MPGLSLTGSELTSVVGLNGLGQIQGGLGSVTFFHRNVSLWKSANGRNIQRWRILCHYREWQPGRNSKRGNLSGSFTGPVTWTLINLANGTHEYQLTGAISGTWYNTGVTVYGATTQLTINTGIGFFNGSTMISSGDTNIVVVPEPGTLGLLGTGLLGLAGVLHRRMKT